MIMVIIFN